MAMDWVRWYHGTAADPKWRLVARKSGQRLTDVIAVWAMVLEAASEASERGTLEGFDPEVVAAALDLEPEAVDAILDAMQGRVLDGDRLSAWDKRNPKREDNSAERVRRYRERKRREQQAETQSKDDVTQCNAGETQGNAPEEDRDVEKERDTSSHPSTSREGAAALRVVEGGADPDDRASRIIRAANRAMADNPAIDQRKFRPIPTGHGSRQDVLDWIAEGIPIDVILEAVTERAREYRPDGDNRQISTMRYFGAAVREAYRRQQTTDDGGHDERRQNHRRSTATEARGTAPRAKAVGSKYAALTIRSGEG